MSAVHVKFFFYFIWSQCITLIRFCCPWYVYTFCFIYVIVLHSRGYISYLCYLCILVFNTYCTNVVIFFFLVLCTLHVSAVSLDCPFSIALSVFSDVYLYQLWWGPTILVISKWCIFSVDFYDIHWLCNMLIHTIFLYFSWWQNYFQSKFVILYSRI